MSEPSADEKLLTVDSQGDGAGSSFLGAADDDLGQSLEETTKKDSQRVLVFSLGQEDYAIDVNEAREVFRPERITRVPNTPEFVSGVANLRGQLVPLIDVRHLIGLPAGEMGKDTRAIMTDIRTSPVGVIVDKIKETREIAKEDIQPPLATIKGKLADFTRGEIRLSEGILILLALDRVLSCEDLEDLRKGGNR